MRLYLGLGTILLAAVALTASCDDDDESSNGTGSSSGGLEDQTGQECVAPGDCFDGILPGDIQGEIQCLDRVEGGYCIHLCQDDDDCCAVEGECEAGTSQVCSPFESTGLTMCFLACEKEDVGSLDADEFCEEFHRDFVCRSSGGGSDNEKICVPGGGRFCEIADECTADFPYCCEDALGHTRCYDAVDAEGRTCLNDPPK